jgi:uncharacterized protein (DUF2141 family)
MLAKIAMLLCCFLTLHLASSDAQNGIYVAVDGLRTVKGQVICLLYSSAENSNGRLDANFLGIPRERVGASNNAKDHFGPPAFLDASIVYSGGHMQLRIVITYL